MKIIEDTSKKEDSFGDLCIGDIFIYSNNINNIFIKIESLCSVTDGENNKCYKIKGWSFMEVCSR